MRPCCTTRSRRTAPGAGIDHEAASFRSPQGILVDPDGSVWVIESGMGGEGRRVGKPDSRSGRDGDDGRYGVVRISVDSEQTEVAALPSVFVGTEAIGGENVWPCSTGKLYATVGQVARRTRPGSSRTVGVGRTHGSRRRSCGKGRQYVGHRSEQNPDGHVVDSHPYGLAAGADGRLRWRMRGNTLVAVDVETGEVTLEQSSASAPGHCPTRCAAGAHWRWTRCRRASSLTTRAQPCPCCPASFIPGSTKVVTVDANGKRGGAPAMLTDLRMGPDGNLYTVQIGVFGEQADHNSEARCPRAGGRRLEVVVSRLSFPRPVDFGADNAYVTTNGVGAPGSGEVVMVHNLVDLPGMPVEEAMQMMMQMMEEAPAPNGSTAAGAAAVEKRNPHVIAAGRDQARRDPALALTQALPVRPEHTFALLLRFKNWLLTR